VSEQEIVSFVSFLMNPDKKENSNHIHTYIHINIPDDLFSPKRSAACSHL
jgi:hypothetical protein